MRGRNDEDDDDMMLLLPRFFAEEEEENPVVLSRFARGEMKDFIQLQVFQSFAIQRNARILLTRMSGVTAPSERGETQRRKKTATECENLGWLASGSCLPRKRKPIENITHASLVFLEAEKAKLKSETAFGKPSSSATTTEETTTKRGKRPTKKRIISNAKRELLKENKGVRERNGKDVRDEEREKTTLETKASLYEKLSKDDDLGGTTTMKIPKDGFECMDFKRKRLEEKEKEEYEYDFGSAYERRRYAGREDEDEDEDEERERNEFREQRRREDEEREAREFRDEEKREKERRLVEDVARETEAARREREEAKMETVEAREKLKRKFIEEKIAQLKEKKRLEKEEKKKKVKTKEAK